jgi:hypothetical protein
MATSKKWLCAASLTAAGLLSLFLSFIGGFGLLWAGFPQKDHSASVLAMFLPFLLAFPLFALAVGVSRLALLALWVAVPFPWLAYSAMLIHGFKGGPANLLKFSAEPAYMALPLFVAAALVQFGTQFYEITNDSQWVRWKASKDASAA